jgi:hypothetical protein
VVRSLSLKFLAHFVLNPRRRYLLKSGIYGVAGVVQPGEDVTVIGYAKIGLNPEISFLAGLVWLDIFEPFFLRPHIVAVTNKRVLVIKLTVPGYRARQLVLAERRENVSLVRAKETWFYYSVWIRYWPNGRVLRLNFPYSWDNEGHALVTAVDTGSAAPEMQSP